MSAEHKRHFELAGDFDIVRRTIGMWRYKREGDWDARVDAAHEALERIEEQFETLRGAAIYAEDELRKYGAGVPLVKARHRLYDALKATSNPASEQKP